VADQLADDVALTAGADRNPAGRRRLAPFVALAVGVVFAVFFVILAGSDTRTNESDPDTPLLGRAAPPIVGPTLDGGSFDLSRRRGSWVVLNFFQSSCAPCKAEHPELVAFAAAQDAAPGGAELVTVVWQDSAAAVQEFFDASGGGTWPVVLDEAGVAVAYGVAKVPETWVIDPNGVIRVHYVGQVTAAGPDGLVAKLAELQALDAGAPG
jgi:cytochrome c biogenesis protein CcmG, thiol:disulfide interchange protein DsbE